MGIFAPLAGLAGDVIGGFIQDKGQKAANKANLKIAREQMDFQERMSSSAYQRATVDLEKAGLNRILALGSPASSPAGARATMLSETAGKGEAARRAAHSAADLKLKDEQMKLMFSQAGALDAQAMQAGSQANLNVMQQRNVHEINREIKARIEEIRARTDVSSAQSVILGTQAELYDAIGPALVAAEKALPSLSNIFRIFRMSLKKRGK